MSKQEFATASLSEVKALVAGFGTFAPEDISVRRLGVLDKTPFNVLSVRGSLFYRTDELLTSAVFLLEKHNIVAAFVLIRAVMENMAIQNRLKMLVDNRKTMPPDMMNKQLHQMIAGIKMDHLTDDGVAFPKPIHIMDLLRDFGKLNPTFMASYESLCELAHPNHQGVIAHYADLEPEKGEMKFGPKADTNEERLKIALGIMNVVVEVYLWQSLNIGSGVEEWTAELKSTEQRPRT